MIVRVGGMAFVLERVACWDRPTEGFPPGSMITPGSIRVWVEGCHQPVVVHRRVWADELERVLIEHLGPGVTVETHPEGA